MDQNYKKILITGANGLLGKTLTKYLEKYYFVIPTSREKNNLHKNHFFLDVTNRNLVGIVLDEVEPDYIINCAAYTNVDKSETNRNDSYYVNVNGLIHI